MRPGQDLVVGGFIGISGTVYAAEKFEADLRKTLPKFLLDAVGRFRAELCRQPGRVAGSSEVLAEAVRGGGITMEDVREGGILAALWNAAERYRAGLAVYLRRIPVRQETVEICEALGLNPYRLLSGGCTLFAADNGNDVLWALGEAGICGAVIGKVTGGRDRLILNGEVRSHLNRPAPDEIEKLKKKTEGVQP